MTHPSPRLEAVNIACRDKHLLGAFWAELLGTSVRGEVEQYLGLRPTAEGFPRLVFQQVDDASLTPSRLHLDLETHDLEADTARALELGATVVTDVTQDFGDTPMRWRVLADPEGNEFCLVPQ